LNVQQAWTNQINPTHCRRCDALHTAWDTKVDYDPVRLLPRNHPLQNNCSCFNGDSSLQRHVPAEAPE
jgi:hypothetical protein